MTTAVLPPGVSYLSQSGSKQIDNNGEATITFHPDTGQYWLPIIVHVSNRFGTGVNCALHSGGIAGQADPTSLRDITYIGFNDSSTILSGTVVQPGQAIVCHFFGGIPGEIAFADITGLSSVAPPTLGVIPTIPGVRFSGSAAPGVQHTLLYLKFNSVVTALETGNAIDVSQTQRIQIRLIPLVNNVRISLNWFYDEQLTVLVNTDQIDGRAVSFADQTIDVKGNFLRVDVEPFGGNATVTLAISNQSQNWVIQRAATDNVIFTFDGLNINAGATNSRVSTRIFCGPALLTVWANTIATASWTARLTSLDAAGAVNALIVLPSLAGTSPTQREMYLPFANVQLDITNNDAVARTFGASLVFKPLYP